MTKTFKVEINGFSITGLKTMVGEDGYITRCNLLFGGRKIGEYFDPADGGAYRFYCAPGFSESAIENAVGTFPSFERDYGLGKEYSTVRWSIGILVDELIDKKGETKAFAKACETNSDLVTINSWKDRRSWMMHIPHSFTDEQTQKAVAKGMLEKKCKEYQWKRYCKEDDFCVNNTVITADMLK